MIRKTSLTLIVLPAMALGELYTSDRSLPVATQAERDVQLPSTAASSPFVWIESQLETG